MNPDDTRIIDSVVVHKPNNLCAHCFSCVGKSKNEGFSGTASLPAKFSTKCTECSESGEANQTLAHLDVAKMKRLAKIRPSILSPNCDISRDSEADAKH